MGMGRDLGLRRHVPEADPVLEAEARVAPSGEKANEVTPTVRVAVRVCVATSHSRIPSEAPEARTVPSDAKARERIG